MRPFHLAFPVHDLAAARAFYVDVLGCAEGRSSDEWIDFNLSGHQIVAHLIADKAPKSATNPVDGQHVPVPHFGIVLDIAGFDALARRVSDAGIEFVIPPTTRFAGTVGEQKTMFFYDPSGNALEFKAFADDSQLFAI
jgi:extradiol dioxygenase family protein